MTTPTPKHEIRNYAIGILLILILLFLFSVMGSISFLHASGFKKPDSTLFVFSRSLYWIAVILLWLYAKKVEKQKLLLWEERKYNIIHYIVSLVAVFGAIIFSLLLVKIIFNLIGLKETSSSLIKIINIFRDNDPLIILTVVTAGVTEELIFRGYLQPRLEILLKKPYLSIIISSVFFGLLHYRFGTIINIVGPFVIGLIFSFYYWKFRNIKVLMLCHALWDLIGIYLYLFISSQHKIALHVL